MEQGKSSLGMKVLVTGAGGLLGGRIIDFFFKNGYKVIGLSRSFKGYSEWGKSVDIVNLDINKPINLNKYLDGVSLVIHAAGMNATDSLKNPVKALSFNGLVTAKLLDESIKCGVKKFIYLSTIHVYSSELKSSINENSCTTNIHPYATTHRAGEDAVLFANNQNKIQGVVLRLSNSFGFPINKLANCWGLLVNDICKQACIKEKIVLKSSGNQYRNFISINEVCRFICFLFENNINSEKSPIINLGSKKSITVLEISNLVKERAQIFFNKKIPLFRQKDIKIEKFKSFKLQTLLLEKLGFSVSNNYVTEIDTLLNYCNNQYRI